MGYEIIWEPKGVVRRFSGHIDKDEILRAVARTQGDSRFDDLQFIINDFLDGSGHSVDLSEIEETAAIENAASLINSKIRIAFVAAAPEFIAQANRYSSLPLIVFPTRIFATRDDARAWLGAPVPAKPLV